MMKRGFTLIEALAVVSIIGILATTATYAYLNATSRSRDARRKSDLTAISLGFQARYDTQTCSDRGDVGHYPAWNKYDWVSEPRWKNTEILRTLSGDCGAFSEYLLTIPIDPTRGSGDENYKFNLSTGINILGKHYRLTAILEKVLVPESPEALALDRAETIWHDSFGGASLPSGYNYIVGN
ncbi:MAG: prepilin-type N-terminal cleavage/methylation domain-containing protein [Patescibacteria group bacterium]